MKILSTASLTFFIGLMAQPAFAQNECDKYNTSYDMTYCMAKLFVESDKELNTVYKNLKMVIKDDAKAKLTLIQRDWIRYRDETCSVDGTINVDCNYRVNRTRIIYLQDRLRECKSANCRLDMIARRSW